MICGVASSRIPRTSGALLLGPAKKPGRVLNREFILSRIFFLARVHRTTSLCALLSDTSRAVENE